MEENTAPTGTTVNQAAEKFKSLMSASVAEKATTVAEDTTEGESPEPTEESAELPEVKTFKVKVDGEEIEVPEDELLKGYSRTADYTRKTQKLAESSKALEAEAQAVKQERQRYADGLRLLESQLQQPENVDWNRLKEEDPLTYTIRKAEERDRKDQLALVRQEQQRVAQLEADEQTRALQNYVQAEQAKLADAIPEWKDAKVAKADKEKLTGYLQGLGYSEAEISQIYDHRAVITVRKAAMYDEMMSKAKTQTEKVKDSPKTAAPGNLQPVGNKQYLETKAQFKANGSLKNAAAVAKLLLRK
jgi:hypothetical protein